MEFEKVLRELRQAKKLTQKELSSETGIAYSTLRSYELGTRSPSIQNFTLLQKYFNVSSEFLRGETNLMKWDDPEIVDGIKDNLSIAANSLITSTRLSSDESQKLIFDILVELRHIINAQQKYSTEEFIAFLQTMFTTSSGMLDVCISSKKDGELSRIDNAIKNTTLVYISSLNQLKDEIHNSEKKDHFE